MVPQVALGLYVARPAAIEDQLPRRRTETQSA